MEKKFGVVSADGHCRLMHLPVDLWTKRLPRKLQDGAPQVVQGADGIRKWVVEDRPWSGVGWAGVGRGPVNCYTRAGLAEEPEPGVFRAANARYRCEDWIGTGSTPNSSTAPTSRFQRSGTRSCAPKRPASGGFRSCSGGLIANGISAARPASSPPTYSSPRCRASSSAAGVLHLRGRGGRRLSPGARDRPR